ncbi:MAG: ATP-binding protein [Chloroflexota bacterium]
MKPCSCSSGAVTKYQKRISGPLLGRIDIHIEVPHVACEKLSDQRQGESSETVRLRVEAARERQRKRFEGVDGVAGSGGKEHRCRRTCVNTVRSMVRAVR